MFLGGHFGTIFFVVIANLISLFIFMPDSISIFCNNTLNIASVPYCFSFYIHIYNWHASIPFRWKNIYILQLEPHNYYQGSASSGGDIPYQCRANPPNPLFLSDRCITIRIGTPHHTLPPAAKSVLPINTRPALNCNSRPLFHNSFYSIVLPMIKYNPRNTF